ncbi:AI-2E family transporter [Aequorivita sp. SDUM287046]|uniref:AI-2E family transporter n=1 Tax=Aequorivita aurantiaca TaxID=3053356 RepID=A0ABT8DFL8_9FLAO|nr:AI-2E family transporter [Aequorivita aurantiaca]MDN3724141.1 AI-2E family transporter [Aequorivita aurantiaca]
MEIKNWFRHSFILIVGAYFLILGLIKAQVFFAPFATAVILSLMMLPIANKLERFIKSRNWVSILCTFLLFLISLCFIGLILYQAQIFIEDWPKLKETLAPKWQELKSFITQNTPIKESDLSGIESGKQLESVGDGSGGSTLAGMLGKAFSFLGNYLLTFIYVFFLLNYRNHFKLFLLKIFPEEKRNEVKRIINECARIAPRYLAGKATMIAILAGLYAIGLGISGIDNFILISILAALFSLIPYIGNIIGFALAVALGFAATGDTSVLIGIALTFGVAQFVESYILEPYVVGDKVDLHPFFVILVVIIGNLMWGVIGMILCIPILAILVVIILHIPTLKPLGELLAGKIDGKKS